VDDARGEDIGAQSGTLDQAREHTRLSKILEVLAGIAQAHPPGSDLSDAEGAPNEGIEADSLGDEVATLLVQFKVDTSLGFEGLQRFELNQGEVSARLWIGWVEVAIAFEAAAGDSVD
jgi:hypothetical protein